MYRKTYQQQSFHSFFFFLWKNQWTKLVFLSSNHVMIKAVSIWANKEKKKQLVKRTRQPVGDGASAAQAQGGVNRRGGDSC